MNRVIPSTPGKVQRPILKTFKRRRCQNCNKLFQPIRADQKFDSASCRKEFHRYGSSYGPLKTGLHSAIDKKYVALEKAFKQQLKDANLELRDELAAMGLRLVRLEQRVMLLERPRMEGVNF